MATRAEEKRMLTDSIIKQLKPAPEGQRYRVWDKERPGLAVFITDKGSKSFIVVGRMPNRRDPRRITLGKCSDMTVKEARDRATIVRAQLRDGKDPVYEAKKEADDVFEKAVEVFLADKQGEMRPASFYRLEGDLRRCFLGQHRKRTWDGKKWISEWANRGPTHFRRWSVLQIKRRDIVGRLDEIKKKESMFVARHALAAIRNFFNWAADGERFGVVDNPAARLRTITISKSLRKKLRRSRVLKDDEIRAVWAAAIKLGYPGGDLVRILLLTAQRKSDWAMAAKAEIDRENMLLVIPGDRYKNGSDHEVPLTPKVLEMLEAMPARSRFLFSTKGRHPLGNMGWFKEKLDTIVTEHLGAPLEPWVIHDLRRTVRSYLSALRIDFETKERILGHRQPELSEVYDQFTFRPQKREALEAWEARLLEIVGERPAPSTQTNVVKLDERRAA